MRAKSRKKIQKVRIAHYLHRSEVKLMLIAILDPIKTLVHEYFEGVLTNETKCMMCETVSTPNLLLARLTRLIGIGPFRSPARTSRSWI
jgi:hypothetical protein